jgi:hypothetical protein
VIAPAIGLLVWLGTALGVWIAVDLALVLVMELAARARERRASTPPADAPQHKDHAPRHAVRVSRARTEGSHISTECGPTTFRATGASTRP